jgi:hypothetical protein
VTPIAPTRSTRLPTVAASVALALAALLAGCGSPGGPTPIADRPIDLDGRCEQTDEAGFREQARLRVVDNRVEALDWQLWVGQRGTCRFVFDDFRQVKFRPSIELVARDGGGCKLLVWQERRFVTLAHAGCEARCTPGIYDDAWPVMFAHGGGGCANP